MIHTYLFYYPRSFLNSDLFNNFAPTLLALIGGIPIALWVDRRIKDRELAYKFIEERQKEIKILKLVYEELNYSLNSLFLNGKKGNVQTLTTQPLKSDLWDSLVSSTDIRYITSPNLLNSIVSAYYVLKIVKNIEDLAYRAQRSATVTFTLSNGSTTTAVSLLLNDARFFDPLFEDNLKMAIKMIKNRLKILKKYEK